MNVWYSVVSPEVIAEDTTVFVLTITKAKGPGMKELGVGAGDVVKELSALLT